MGKYGKRIGEKLKTVKGGSRMESEEAEKEIGEKKKN